MTDEIRIDLKFDVHQPPCDHSPKGGTLERIGAHDYVCRSCWKLFKVGVMAKEVAMTSEDRKAIVEALEAIASALSFAESDMPMVMSDRLNALHVAIGKLKEVRDD